MTMRRTDPLCDYRLFKSRIGGKIACLSYGTDTIENYVDSQGEITGLCFQKVDEGKVQPVLASNTFTKVDWRNGPTRQGNYQNLCLDSQIFVPTQAWQQFGDLLVHLRHALICQMTPENGVPPNTLFEGFHSDVWNGGTNSSRQMTATRDQLKVIKQMIGKYWIDDPIYVEFVDSLMRGFSAKADVLKTLLNHLLHIFIFRERSIVQGPSKTSNTNAIEDGVIHCLIYGYNPEQIEIAQRNDQYHICLRHRVLLPNTLHKSSRSRSRSPSPVYDITEEVHNVRNPQVIPTMQDMLEHPDDYELLFGRLHSYTEPHKPYFIICCKGDDGFTVKIIVDISSYVKFGPKTSFASHLAQTTDQCVQHCLAGLSFNQENITGLIFVPDGMKLVKVVKQSIPHQVYRVQESELIRWHETNKIFTLLEVLRYSME